MRKMLLVVGLFLSITQFVFAGQTVEHHTFYDRYDPASTSFVYNQDAATSTGDQVAVNTYTQKIIQIAPIIIGEYIEVQIEGRSQDQKNTPNWAILDVVAFGVASADTSKNVIVDVTEFVDWIRVGIRRSATNGTSSIDIKGIFTNLDR